ncbi:tetratricopeptide repeat protein [Prevotella sp. SGI.027]
MEYSDSELQQIRNIITSEQNVGEALKSLRSFINANKLHAFDARISRIESDYELMKAYMRKGLNDPQFEEVYDRLLNALYVLNADVQLAVFLNENPSYQAAYMDVQSLDADFDVIKKRLEAFVQDIALLSLEPQEAQKTKKQELYDRHQQYVKKLFNALLVSPQWNESTAKFAQDLLLSPTIDAIDAQLLLSGVMLSVIQLFDIHQFQTLVQVYRQATEPHLRQRALVGIVLSLPENEGDIYPEIQQTINTLCQDEQTCRELVELQLQMFYCMNADADNEKLQKDIIPNLMKGSNISISRAGIVEKEEDEVDEMLNPGAADQAMEEMERNFNQMMNMQKAGSDIYFGGFSHMKRFAFFMTLSNWFVPFYEDHPGLQQVNDKLGGNKFMQLLLESGPFCDSDKYSFILGLSSIIDKIPQNMREMLDNQDAFYTTVSREEKSNPAYIRRMYLQDLYRFYRIYQNKNDFHNPFDTSAMENSAFFVMSPYFRESPLKDRMMEVGKFLYKHHFYRELWQLLGAYVDREDIEYWRLAAMAYYREKDYLSADKAYTNVLEMNADDVPAIRGKALAGFYLENYEQAVEYNKKLLEMDATNEHVQLNLAVSLMNNDEIEEAMSLLFKLNYDHPENLSIQRSLAWGYLQQQKPQQAAPIYERLLANKHRMPTDCLNAGYCQWFLSNVEEAIDLFRKYVAKAKKERRRPGASNLLHDVFAMDADLLQQYGIGMKEAFVMEDLVVNK